ncbi:MAG: hypothetical protein HY898_34120 [Deltaproteobacteria bacterium]|nr:hypothetical protein [Deltaproteobacteria bacterium]
MTRGWLFTWMTVVMFTVGCAGAYQDPATPADYASADDPPAPAQPEPAYEQVSAADQAALTNADYQDTDPSALTEFKSELDPYGVWINDPTYGMVWMPNASVVGADFAPYSTGGQWALTADGDWIWESTYPFGWVTFHYGRWVWLPGQGWAWIAGRRYAHAWVTWRTGYDGYSYIGWAPMPPWYYWSGGVAVGLWVVPPAPYMFCHSHYVFGPDMHSHMVTGAGVREAAQRTRPYTPANPSMGSGNGGHRFASPTRGPSLAQANIPGDKAPKSYAAPNPKAWSMARPSSPASAASHALVRPPSGVTSRAGAVTPGSSVSRATYSGMPTRMSRETYATRGASPAFRSSGSPSYRSSPSPYYGPSSGHSSSVPGYRAPSYGRSPSYGASPSYGSSYRSPTPSYGSSRSYSPPSYSGGSSFRGGGSPSFHAPSAPPSYRPPSSGSSMPSGGRSFGGGHSRGGGGRHR